MNNGGMVNKEYTLKHGSHRTREEGMCLMEAVAWLAGEEHTDQPVCVCPLLAEFGLMLNDAMGRGAEGDALRAEYLSDLASRLVGTRATREIEQARARVLADHAVRVFTPIALDAAGLTGEAAQLRCLEPVTDKLTADAAKAAAGAAWAATYGAWAASRAAWATVRAAADAEAAWSAAWAADSAAARAAANAAAWAAYDAASAARAADSAALRVASKAAAMAADSAARSARAAGPEAWAAARAAFVAALEVKG